MERKLNKKTRNAVNKGLKQAREGKLISAQGLKYDGGKPPLSLLPGRSLRELAKVMDYGKRKYDAHNWRKGLEFSRLLDASLRHLSHVTDGTLLDEESGLSHLAHAAVNILFLLEFMDTRPELNDLYKAKGGEANE